MNLETLISKGATINPLLREAGLRDDLIKDNRVFQSRWAWDDGQTAVATVWIDEIDMEGVPSWSATNPALRTDLKEHQRPRAVEVYEMLTRRNGQAIRVILQRKRADRTKAAKGLADARGVDPSVWYVQANNVEAKIQRGVPFESLSTAQEEFDLSRFVLGDPYTRKEIVELGGTTRPASIFASKWSEGIVEFRNAVVLFVTLEKGTNSYDDYFQGSLFYWQSQNRQTQNTPVMRRVIDGDLPCFLFARVKAKTAGKTEPFVYCGALSTPTAATGSKPVTCVFRSLDYVEGASGPLGGVYLWKPTTSKSEEETERHRNLKTAATKGGQGRQPDTELRIDIEWYAMTKAREHYESEGWTVEDTSANRPYDLLCTRNNESLRVEVKGTTSAGDTVFVTIGEVKAARDPAIQTDLFIVKNVKVTHTGASRALSEGHTKIVSPWLPHDDDLQPTQFQLRIGSSED